VVSEQLQLALYRYQQRVTQPRGFIYQQTVPLGRAANDQRYGPWPAPDGYYSTYVVWRTCLRWELLAWLAQRGWVG
jgi:hypothetical protein